MALTVMLVLTAVLIVVPLLVHGRYQRRAARGVPPLVERGPARGSDFFTVDTHIAAGTRATDPRIRGLVRAEIAWRRSHARQQPDSRQVPWWAWAGMGSGSVVLVAFARSLQNAVLAVIYVGYAVVLRLVQRRDAERRLATYEAALAANAD